MVNNASTMHIKAIGINIDDWCLFLSIHHLGKRPILRSSEGVEILRGLGFLTLVCGGHDFFIIIKGWVFSRRSFPKVTKIIFKVFRPIFQVGNS